MFYPSQRPVNLNQVLAHEARLNRLHRLFKTHFNVTEPSLVLEPYLFLGNCISAHDIHRLTRLGVRYVLNVAKRDVEVCPYYPKEMRTLTIDLRDDDRENIIRAFDEAFAFIDEARRVKSRVLVHCSHGQSRSPAIVIAYLMRSYNVSLEQCLSHVVKARPCVIPNDGFLKQLILYDRFLVERRRQQQEAALQKVTHHAVPTEIPIQHHPTNVSEPVPSPPSNTNPEPVTVSSVDSSSLGLTSSSSVQSSVSNNSIQVIPIQMQSKEPSPEKIEPVPIQKLPETKESAIETLNKHIENLERKQSLTNLSKTSSGSRVESSSSSSNRSTRSKQRSHSKKKTEIKPKQAGQARSGSNQPVHHQPHHPSFDLTPQQWDFINNYPAHFGNANEHVKTNYITEIYDRATNRFIPTTCCY